MIVICLILFILISISTVSAVDENTNVITVNNDDNNILNINDINNEILRDESDGSFADLNTKINGDTSTDIVLDKNYTYSDFPEAYANYEYLIGIAYKNYKKQRE